MTKCIAKVVISAIIIHALLLWVGPEIVMRKLDSDLEAAKTFVEECGEEAAEDTSRSGGCEAGMNK